jgi:hypothetical protein
MQQARAMLAADHGARGIGGNFLDDILGQARESTTARTYPSHSLRRVCKAGTVLFGLRNGEVDES